MTDKEKIQGSALLKLFAELQSNAIPLKMLLPDSDEVQLAYIKDINKRKKALHFEVDSPEEFLKLSGNGDQPPLNIEFIDQESIMHVFETGRWNILHETIWVELPEFVYRFQRRKLFRLEAPHGTRLFFNVNDIGYKLLVIDVSLRGALGVLTSLTDQMRKELKPYASKLLKDAELLFPAEDYKKTGSIVNIKYCQINRMERNPETDQFEVAIEFKQVSKAEQKNLIELFYKWQREYLRRRKLLRK